MTMTIVHHPSFDRLIRIASFPGRIWRAWRNRASCTELLDMDDRALRDIGLTRCDVACLLATPLTTDPSGRLAELVQERRAGQLAQARERLAEWGQSDYL